MALYDIEDFARDLAFEINLGGDRLDRSDVRAYLCGIPSSDLATLGERILVHSGDFVRSGKYMASDLAFVSRMIPQWLDGVKTAESLGEEAKSSWFKDIDVSRSKGMYFVFDDGRILLCDKATVRAAWGREASKHIIKMMSPKEAALHYADVFVSHYGHNVNGEKRAEFITNCSLPYGSPLCLSGKDGKYDFIVRTSPDEKERIPFEKLYDACPYEVFDLVNHELDERLMREIGEREIKRQDVRDFRLRANALIDRTGERVRGDFLWDQVLVESNDKGEIYVRRSVDDLSEKDALSLYVYVKTPSGSSMSLVSEDYDAGALRRLDDIVCKRLSEIPGNDVLSVDAGRIDFKDGPLVYIPEYDENGPLRMKVESVYEDYEGNTVVHGIVRSSGGEFRTFYPLSILSDKGVQAVREASEAALGILQKKEPRPEIAREQKGTLSVKKTAGNKM